jgi:cleavage and polyadenylation specificity factor subunit 1
MRLPPFWAERPAAWCAQAEAQFFLAGVNNEKTKFFHVISQLDHRHAAEVEDLNISPPERDPYTMLRTELVRRLSPSTPFDIFEFPFMSFGLRYAAQTFQRFVDGVLRGFDFCFACVDDILVFSRSLEEHEQHLRALFTQLQKYGIIINPAKCIFRAPEVTFLGYKVSAEGSQPLEERVTHLQNCHPPKTASQLCQFLCMLNFYRRFLPHAAATQAPLHDVLSCARVNGSHPITWTPEFLKAFEKCKASLARTTLLAHPDPTAPLALVTDASTSAMGAVLQQHVQNAWQPL